VIEGVALVRVYGVGAGRQALGESAGICCILAMSIVLLCDVLVV
jgi:hypothetical protein